MKRAEGSLSASEAYENQRQKVFPLIRELFSSVITSNENLIDGPGFMCYTPGPAKGFIIDIETYRVIDNYFWDKGNYYIRIGEEIVTGSFESLDELALNINKSIVLLSMNISAKIDNLNYARGIISSLGV